MSITTPKFAAQAIRKAAEMGWKPVHLLNNVSISVGAVLKPAGLENAVGILTAGYEKDQTDPQWKDDAGMKKFHAYVEKYIPEGKAMESTVLSGYSIAQTMVDYDNAVLNQAAASARLERDVRKAFAQLLALNLCGVGSALLGEGGVRPSAL